MLWFFFLFLIQCELSLNPTRSLLALCSLLFIKSSFDFLKIFFKNHIGIIHFLDIFQLFIQKPFIDFFHICFPVFIYDLKNAFDALKQHFYLFTSSSQVFNNFLKIWFLNLIPLVFFSVSYFIFYKKIFYFLFKISCFDFLFRFFYSSMNIKW